MPVVGSQTTVQRFPLEQVTEAPGATWMELADGETLGEFAATARVDADCASCGAGGAVRTTPAALSSEATAAWAGPAVKTAASIRAKAPMRPRTERLARTPCTLCILRIRLIPLFRTRHTRHPVVV
ncbi:hypothetical protein GCM10018775_48130 [Streptomyces umbrinus]|nr:hypothetical protein GCM10018775_48130 [Streptomyces umbrinus]